MYCKLFTSLYQGTLRGRSDEILVFTNLLAHCDRFGVSDIHPKSIAEEVGIPLERVQAALDSLEAPDIESRSPENEGRRISRMDEHRAWGWVVTNYEKYRAIKNEDDRREQNRLAQKKFRDKNKPPSSDVSDRNHSKPPSAHAEAEVDAEADAKKTVARAKPLRPTAEFLISEAKNSPAYQGIDVEREWHKMAAWCSKSGKPITARRYTNWLNRIDAPVSKSTPLSLDPFLRPQT